jgi:D-psicose/D-tagatose/L-ribulose 3-epimerase
MPRFGTHAFTLHGVWNDEVAPKVISLAAELGFDFLEIPILRPNQFDSDVVARALQKCAIEAVASLCLAKDCHLPFNPRAPSIS